MNDLANQLGLSELQLALGFIGFCLLLIVMIYNAMRIKKIESSSDSFSLASASSDRSEVSRQEPTLAAEQQAAIAVKETHFKIDSLIDAVVAMRLPEPISGREILDHMRDWPRNTIHLSLTEGLANQVEGFDPIWEPLNANNQYIELQVSIQLANRQGPIGMVDLSDFLSRSQALANSLDAEIDMPPVNQLLDEARQIDQFAASADIQLGITVIPQKGLWNLAEIKNAAIRAGFHLSRDGRSYQRVSGQVTLYSLIAGEANFLRDDLEKPACQSITLLLDLPKVPQELSPFETMLVDARLLADALIGDLVDDTGRPLVDEAVTAISGQLREIYAMMAGHGIPSGSLTAYRLFS